jgi:hypothetical protein
MRVTTREELINGKHENDQGGSDHADRDTIIDDRSIAGKDVGSREDTIMSDLYKANKYLVLNKGQIFIPKTDLLARISVDHKTAGHDDLIAFTANAISLNYVINWRGGHGDPDADDLFGAFDGLNPTSVGVLESALSVLKDSRGIVVDYSYEPMYPDFPKQVVEASDEELIVNAFMHYLGDLVGARIMPDYKPSDRLPLIDGVKPVSLTVIDQGPLIEAYQTVISSGQVWSDDQKDFVRGVVSVLGTSVTAPAQPGYPKIRENAVLLYSLFKNVVLIKSPTDVLRLAALYSDGDPSLAAPTRFKLTRSQRREIMHLLTNVLTHSEDNEFISDEFYKHAEEWKRLATTLHHWELTKKDQATTQASQWLNKVQQGESESLDGQIDRDFQDILHPSALRAAYISSPSYDGRLDGYDLIKDLSKRPGVYARRLVEALRKTPVEYHDAIISGFKNVAGRISNRVLIQMWGLFTTRIEGKVTDLPMRSVIERTAHGQKSVLIDNKIFDDVTVDEARKIVSIIEEALTSHKKQILTKFIDDKNSSYVVPMGVSSASSGVRIIGRGSRFKISDWSRDKVVRLFVHWHDLTEPDLDSYDNSRVDLDLSAVLYSYDLKTSRQVSYTNLREGRAVHSGDITSAPEGASEFIDIPVREALASGVRYVMPSVYSFTRQRFSTIPEAWAGVMMKTELGQQTGEIFDARTVAQKWDLTKNSMNLTPFALDMQTGEVIWMDSDVGSDQYLNRVDGNENMLALQLRSALYTRVMPVRKAVELLSNPVAPAGGLPTPSTIHSKMLKVVNGRKFPSADLPDKAIIKKANPSDKDYDSSSMRTIRGDDAAAILSLMSD